MKTEYIRKDENTLTIREVVPEQVILEKVLPDVEWSYEFVVSQIKAITEQADGWVEEATKKANDYKELELPKLEKAKEEMEKLKITAKTINEEPR